MPFVPSPRQTAIAEKLAQPENLLVQACAGSGKTTTMVWLASAVIPSHMRVLALSFNKSIADELARRMPSHVRSATMHSVGFGMIRKAQPRVRVDDKKLLNIIDTHPGIVTLRDPVRGVVVSDLLGIVPLAQDCLANCQDLAQLSALAEVAGRTLEDPARSLPLVASIVAAMDAMRSIITFAEMIRHPVIHSYSPDFYDVVMVDEAQDLNASQHELLKKLVHPQGKLIAVGDRYQSIYGFRGADPRSMDRLKAEWNMTELPLDVSYRCGSAIVAEAQKIIGSDTIQPRPDAQTGTVGEAKHDALPELVQEGDMVLCRCNAPLVPVALKMLRAGKKATIRGRDIGATLASLVRRLRASEVPELIAKLVEWRDDKMEKARKAKKPDSALQAIEDQAATLEAIATECATVADVLSALSALFADDRPGVVLSTVHKAKGLEAGRVWIYGPELLPAPWAKSPQEIEQERNIAYVATTRAIDCLMRVSLPPRKAE